MANPISRKENRPLPLSPQFFLCHWCSNGDSTTSHVRNVDQHLSLYCGLAKRNYRQARILVHVSILWNVIYKTDNFDIVSSYVHTGCIWKNCLHRKKFLWHFYHKFVDIVLIGYNNVLLRSQKLTKPSQSYPYSNKSWIFIPFHKHSQHKNCITLYFTARTDGILTLSQ